MKKFTMIKYNKIIKNKINNYESSFVIKPLERGFANTLGNCLRRVLLSSIPGFAPIAVKIENVEHEFQTIANVEEDVVKLILNLKKVRFFYNPELLSENEIFKVTLKANKGKVYAKDIVLPAGFEIVNKDQYIANLTKKDALKLELFVIDGRGFVSFEDNKTFIKDNSEKIISEIQNGSLIAVDSNFSPIENVTFNIKELNTASSIIEEELKINVKTDGSINSLTAFNQAAKILQAHFQVLSEVENLEVDEIFTDQPINTNKQTNQSIPISQLDLSVRSFNSLKRSNYNTIEELSKITIKELNEIRNLGKKSREEIINKLAEFNIILEEGE